MSEYLKANVSDAPYFITLTVVGWIDVFTREIYSKELIKNLVFCQDNRGLEIFAYVLMPSHLHMICRRKAEAGLLSDLLRDFKSYTSKQLMKMIAENEQESRKEWLLHLFKYYAKFSKQNKEMMFWQKTSHPVELYSTKMIEQKLEYIHQNPVKSGIVIEPWAYLYSSACTESPLKVLDAW